MELIESRFNSLMMTFRGVESQEFKNALDAFVAEFGNDKSYSKYKRHVDYFEADLLSESQEYGRALEIYTELYRTEESVQRYLYVQQAAATHLALGCEEDAVSLVEEHIGIGEETHFSYYLDLLFWLVSNVLVSEERLSRHGKTVNSISIGLGIRIPESVSTLKEAILFLKKERMAANWRYSALLFSIEGSTEEERAMLVKEFVSCEEVRYFSEMAAQMLPPNP